MLAAVFAVILQQAAPLPAATGQVVWETPVPVEAAQPVPAAELPPIVREYGLDLHLVRLDHLDA